MKINEVLSSKEAVLVRTEKSSCIFTFWMGQTVEIIRIKLLGQCQDKGLYQANVDLEAEGLSKTELVNY